MGTTPASPEDRASSGEDGVTPQAEAVETNIPCGHCPDGILLIRDDGYVYCPACDHERPPQRGRAAHTASSDTSTVAEHRSRYPERIDDTDLFVPKVELAAAASDAARAANDADYVAYQQRYSAAIQPATPSRPRHATTAASRRHGARRAG
ncbi:hypothetical protein NY547_11140 [Cnuibacter physcomitrellae]|uniref:hypothetical protein n=1 Tax=Cnuibacter physcomitrellae TaxID=1619308 RepID=UPI002175F3D8|nr:hypothetical protein [Cnuibacter physcomitrellae]MCS5497791.1 hypothetical protein [Cnuibacter physcomitrellae]